MESLTTYWGNLEKYRGFPSPLQEGKSERKNPIVREGRGVSELENRIRVSHNKKVTFVKGCRGDGIK